MKSYGAHAKRLTLGYGCIVLSVLGAILPVLQGGLFFLIGLFLLKDDAAWAGGVLKWIQQKFPKCSPLINQAAGWVDWLLKKFGLHDSKAPQDNKLIEHKDI